MQHPDFGHILQNSWNEPLEGKPMFVLAAKLRGLKGVLKQVNLTCYSNISKRVLEAKEKLVVFSKNCLPLFWLGDISNKEESGC